MFNPHDSNSPPRFNISADGNFDVDALYGRGMLPDSSTNSRASGSSSNLYELTGPLLARWTRDVPDAGLHLVAAFRPTDPTVRRMGEIPSSDVVHTTGPARTVRHVSRQVSMPSTPYTVPQTLGAETSSTITAETRAPLPLLSSQGSQSQTVTITKEVREQILHTAKCKIVASLFTRDAMSQTSSDRKRLVRQAIMNVVPWFCSLNTSFNSVVNKAQCKVVSQALTSTCGKVIDIARSGVPHAYELYRPSHHTTGLSPGQCWSMGFHSHID
ncbi:hypothetical protein BDR03DRAFT_1006786 [Suillus americanus]|nr:hypothetical protein BDR03DRAFT_1006786 [Suillus americanus]